MSIRGKTIVQMGAVFVLALAVLIPYTVVQLGVHEVNELSATAGALTADVDHALRAKSDVWLTNALQIARNRQIVNAVAERDRDTAITLLTEYGDAFREETNFRNVRVHLIDADQRSFVKSWAPDNWGESLDYSSAYASVLSTGQPMVTMEPAPNGLRLKGLFPIRNDGEVIGVVNFEGGLNSIKRDFESEHLEFLYALDQRFLDIADGLANAPRIGDYAVSQSDVNDAFLAYAQMDLDLEAARDGYTIDDRYLTVAIPVVHSDGSEIGIYLVGQETGIATAVLAANRRLILTLAVVFGGIVLLLIVLQVFFLERNVIGPVGRFTATFDRIAAGDLSATIDVPASSYLGGLATAGETMMERVRGFTRNVHDATTATEETQREVERQLERTLSAANTISHQSNQTGTRVRELTDAIGSATRAIETIDGSVNTLTRHTSDQASAVSQTTAAVEEMSASIRSIAQIARDRSSDLSSLVTATNEVSEQIDTTITTIDGIGARISEMLELAEVINHVTEQTNLLSMNAAIEAAHAGEHGRGFAVVSDEIRKLAESTQESSGRITTTLTELAGAIRGAVADSRETGTAFERIMEGSRHAVSSFEEITRSTDELDAGSGEMVRAAEQLMQIAEEVQNTASGIRESMGVITGLVDGVSATTGDVDREMEGIHRGTIGVNEAMDRIARASITSSGSVADLVGAARQFTISDEMTDAQARAATRLHLSKLILQHAAWVTRARSYLDGTTEIDADTLVDHTRCDLGVWLASGAADDLMTDDQRTSLDTDHRELHETLRRIVEARGAGTADTVNLESMFAELISCSGRIIALLSAVRDGL